MGNLSKTISEIVVAAIGEPAKELGEIFGDHIRYFRWKSATKVLQRAQKWADENAIEPREVPTRFIVPFLENCSIEEEESDMSERWSRLLLNAVDSYDSRYERYCKILANISSEEADILRKLWETISDTEIYHYDKYREFFDDDGIEESGVHSQTYLQKIFRNKEQPGRIIWKIDVNELPNKNEIVFSGFELGDYLLNLKSLNLIKSYTHHYYEQDGTSIHFYADITPLGYDFVSSVETDWDKIAT